MGTDGGLKGLAGGKCIAMGLEVQIHLCLGGLLFSLVSSSALSDAASPFLSLSVEILSSPALLFYHSVCLSLLHYLSHQFISGLVIYLRLCYFLSHAFSLIGIQPV